MAKHIKLIKFLGKRVNLNGSSLEYKPVMINLLAQKTGLNQSQNQAEQSTTTNNSTETSSDIIYTNANDLPIRFKRRELSLAEMECINNLVLLENTIGDLRELQQCFTEDLEEIPTHDLYFVLVDAYLCHLFSMHPDREFSLLHSTTHAQSFLAQCSLFEITPLSIQNREEKIAAYRMQKHIAAEIAKIELNGSMEDWEGDDEVMREYCILSLRSNAQLCIELLAMNAMERRLLEMKVDMPINVTSESEARLERKTQHTGPLLSDKGKALRPFTITGREKVQKSVFQYGHTLPSMSIDEYLSREMERGNFLTGGGKKSEDNGVKLDLEDEDDSEAALTRKREWDAFKDDNVRGAGNRYNKG